VAARFAVTERHEHHLVAGRRRAVPAAMLADKDAVGELGAHDGRREGKAKRCHMRSETVIGTSGGTYFFGVLGLGARIDRLSPIAVGPAIEAAFLYRGEVIGHEVRPDLVALVDHGKELAGIRLDGKRGRVAKA